MIVKAQAKYVRMAPQKVRLVAGVVRGLDLSLAINKLAIIRKRAVTPVLKLLNSAKASAVNNYNLSPENLFVKEIRVDDGPTLFRWMPKAHGRATTIRKRTSQISLVLAEKVESKSNKTNKKTKIKTDVRKENIAKEEIVEAVENTEKAGKQATVPAKSIKNKAIFKDPAQRFNKDTKKAKGVFRKMFRRKSGE